VMRGGGVEAAELEIEIAKSLERLRRGRVQLDRAAQVPEGGIALALGPIHRPALEVGRHGLRIEGQRPAVGLDGLEGAAGLDRRIAFSHKAVELAFSGPR